MPGPVYHTDAKGERWRVWDICFGPPHAKPHRRLRADPIDLRANYRAFVNAAGEAWWYAFRPGDDRSTEPEVLLAQRRAAGYVSRERYDPSEREPRG